MAVPPPEAEGSHPPTLGAPRAGPHGTPEAEIEVDAGLARRLLEAQHPDLAGLPITPVASGWDNIVLRLGADMALRLPRRQAGATLIGAEQRWLPELAPRLPLAVPAPLRRGSPQEGYPWRWSVTPWIEGETADVMAPDEAQGPVLAAFFGALHAPAPEEAPRNPFRGVPLAARADAFAQRLDALAGRPELVACDVRSIWADALAAPLDAPETWIHGDPHPRNILVREGRLVGVVDWGDMARGDRAADLAGLWMVLPSRRSRREAKAALGDVSEATWRRARGWAVLYALMLLAAGLADDPGFAAIGHAALRRLAEGP